MLDQISRALPPMLWLTELKQSLTDVTIDGKCTTLTGISDFVANLEATGYFQRSIEIVSTTAETGTTPAAGDLVKFSLKAVYQNPSDAKPPTGTAPAGRAPAPATKTGG
jgi:Tfp pilus assembly protein PilN